MALVATAGATSANSYTTRAEANAYFQLAVNPKKATWFALQNETKDEWLIRATQTIDAQPINGTKLDTNLSAGVPDQALKFPLDGDSEGGTAYIRDVVKRCTYEQAIYLAEAGDGSTTRQRLQAQGVTSVTIDDVSETYGSSGTSGGVMLLAPIVKTMLYSAGLIRRTGTISP